jgi:hypothetical protein
LLDCLLFAERGGILKLPPVWPLRAMPFAFAVMLALRITKATFKGRLKRPKYVTLEHETGLAANDSQNGH